MVAKKKIMLIIASLLLGALVTALGYGYYIQTTFVKYLEDTYYSLESSSNVAFNDKESDSNAFLQLQNSAIIRSALEAKLIDNEYGKQLSALFMTRACINYESHDNKEFSDSICRAAAKDFSSMIQNEDFDGFKKGLTIARDKLIKMRESNDTLEPTR